MLEINLAKAKELIGLAIDEKGADYVYPYSDCVYALEANTTYPLNGTGRDKIDPSEYDEGFPEVRNKEATPGCGVGLGLFKGGIGLGILLDTGADAVDALHTLADRGLLTFTRDGINFLQKFQGLQDKETPWGEAFKVAEAHIESDEYRENLGSDDTNFYSR